jgi:hypothetical protein
MPTEEGSPPAPKPEARILSRAPMREPEYGLCYPGAFLSRIGFRNVAQSGEQEHPHPSPLPPQRAREKSPVFWRILDSIRFRRRDNSEQHGWKLKFVRRNTSQPRKTRHEPRSQLFWTATVPAPRSPGPGWRGHPRPPDAVRFRSSTMFRGARKLQSSPCATISLGGLVRYG